MVDLIVDASLDDTNRDLKAILDEFENAGKDAKDDKGIWGQSDVASAMDAFANNWYVHRQAIQSRLSKLSNDVDKSCSTWSDADKQLADSLQTDNGQQTGTAQRAEGAQVGTALRPESAQTGTALRPEGLQVGTALRPESAQTGTAQRTESLQVNNGQ
jgi:hypothetical protein